MSHAVQMSLTVTASYPFCLNSSPPLAMMYAFMSIFTHPLLATLPEESLGNKAGK
jgi:hypothetical protein